MANPTTAGVRLHRLAFPCDVTDFESLPAIVDTAVASLGGLDAVVTVAGRGMVGTIATGSPQAWRDLFDLTSSGR